MPAGRCCFTLTVVLAAASAIAAARDHSDEAQPRDGRDFVADVQFGHLAGDYGTGSDSELQSVSPRLRWLSSRREFRIVVPVLRLSEEGNVRIVGGTPIPDALSLAPLVPPSAPRRESSEGLGDAKAAAEVFVVRGIGERHPWISLSAEIKLPTGDEEAGFGTGEVDYTGGTTLLQPLGDRVHLLVDAGYTRMGDPPEFDYDDVITTGVGLACAVGAREGRQIQFYVENRTHPLPGLADRLDAQLGGSLRFGAALRGRITVTILAGLSDTAEDFGASLALAHTF